MSVASGTAPPPADVVPDVPVVKRGKIQLPRSPKLLIGLGVLVVFIILASSGRSLPPSTRRAA